MMLLTFVLAFLTGVLLGYMQMHLHQRAMSSLKSLRTLVDSKQDKKEPKFTSNTSNTVIDPLDPLTVARFEHDIQMKILNPEARDD